MKDAAMHVKLPYLVEDHDRHGNIRRYVRMPGAKKVRIKVDPGTEEFALAYWAARRGEAPEKTRLAPPRKGTFRWIVQHYLASAEFRKLDPRLTQRPRILILDAIVEKIGDLPAVIDPKLIRQGVKDRSFGAAKDFLAALRGVYRVACEDDLVSTDPTRGVRLKRAHSEGFHTWTAEECDAYEKFWPLGTKQRTAYAIGLYTAQRSSDAVQIGRPHEKDGRLRFTQQKNRNSRPVDVDIPIVPPLREALDAWQGTGLFYIETAYGRPFTPDGFRGTFRGWCDKAGLPPECAFHGLRKAAAARMADNGCTPHQIMAALGHRTHQQAATYTAKAKRATLADAALGGLYGEQNVPPSGGVGRNRQKTAGKTDAA